MNGISNIRRQRRAYLAGWWVCSSFYYLEYIEAGRHKYNKKIVKDNEPAYESDSFKTDE